MTKINPEIHFCPQCYELKDEINLKLILTLPAPVCQSCFGLIDVVDPYLRLDEINMNNGDMLDAFGFMDVDQLHIMLNNWFGPEKTEHNLTFAGKLHVTIQMIAINKLVKEEIIQIQEENPL